MGGEPYDTGEGAGIVLGIQGPAPLLVAALALAGKDQLRARAASSPKFEGLYQLRYNRQAAGLLGAAAFFAGPQREQPALRLYIHPPQAAGLALAAPVPARIFRNSQRSVPKKEAKDRTASASRSGGT